MSNNTFKNHCVKGAIPDLTMKHVVPNLEFGNMVFLKKNTCYIFLSAFSTMQLSGLFIIEKIFHKKKRVCDQMCTGKTNFGPQLQKPVWGL